MLASFGAPLHHDDAAGAAAAAALEIAALSESTVALGPTPLCLGAAIHNGPVVIGNIHRAGGTGIEAMN